MKAPSDFEYLQSLARDFEPDLYYAALLAPAEAQRDFVVLAAYIAETGRISTNVPEPSLAEIRVQWWREALAAAAVGNKSGNPILDQLAEVLTRRGISFDEASRPLDALSREIDGAPFQQDEDFVAFLDQGSGAVERMALKISAGEGALSADAQRAFTAASLANGAIRLARRLPELVRHGRGPFPPGSQGLREGMNETAVRGEVAAASRRLVEYALGQLQEARGGLSGLTGRERAAILPLALTAPYAAKLSSSSRDALQDCVEIAPLNRLLRLWWYARTGRL
jgi:15-cis-phytoene synthase